MPLRAFSILPDDVSDPKTFFVQFSLSRNRLFTLFMVDKAFASPLVLLSRAVSFDDEDA